MKKLFVLMVICFICLSGCASVPIRRHSQFDNYFSTGEKTVTLMPIDIKFYKLTAGGMSEQMDEWDADSDELFKAAVDESVAHGLVTEGDLVVITAGMPLGVSGTTNMMRVNVVGE